MANNQDIRDHLKMMRTYYGNFSKKLNENSDSPIQKQEEEELTSYIQNVLGQFPAITFNNLAIEESVVTWSGDVNQEIAFSFILSKNNDSSIASISTFGNEIELTDENVTIIIGLKNYFEEIFRPNYLPKILNT